MTVMLRDASDYDQDPIAYTGLAGLTHKATEGTIPHDLAWGTQLGPRLNAARAAGVPVLGSYHVLRTPGSSEPGGAAGTLTQQLGWWVARLDDQVPWWRIHPNWVMQIDAETWSYDPDQASNVLAFAQLLTASGLPGWKVTYASRGEYGDSLTGIPTPLWNADYPINPTYPTYPGDTWVPGWAPYSGRTPTLLQWNGGPDWSAFRGTLDELLALTKGPDMTVLLTIVRPDGSARTGPTDGLGNFHWIRDQAGVDEYQAATGQTIRRVTEALAADAYGIVLDAPTPAPTGGGLTADEVRVVFREELVSVFNAASGAA